MAGAPRLSTADLIIKELKKSRSELSRLANALPNEDAYATAYCVLVDGINTIGELIKTIKPSLKEAKEYRKQNPDQFPNRARKWCVIHDSRRKPSADSEDASSSDEKAP
jgi:hypothetical protein